MSNADMNTRYNGMPNLVIQNDPLRPRVTEIKEYVGKGVKRTLSITLDDEINSYASSCRYTTDDYPGDCCKTCGSRLSGDSCRCVCFNTCRSLYEDKVETDFKMVSSDGSNFPCHRAILALKLPALLPMLSNKDSWESKNSSFKFPADMNINSQAMDIFLRYTYYGGTNRMNNDVKVMMAMVRAGHSCQMNSLVEIAGKRILEIQDFLHDCRMEHCGLIDLAKFLKFVQAWENNNPLKQKLIEWVQKNVSETFQINEQAAGN